MVVYYDSRTGNVRRFVQNLQQTGLEVVFIQDLSCDASIKPGVLITYTTGKGAVPPTTETFLAQHHESIISVSSSGNMNWGPNYAGALNRIIEQYPHIAPGIKFELSGRAIDITLFNQHLKIFN